MTKFSLRSGMLVVLRNEEEYLVMEVNGELILTNLREKLSVGFYKEDLTPYWLGYDYDIMQIYLVPSESITTMLYTRKRTLIWERDETAIREVTLHEVYKKFGCRVKIVEG